MTTQQPLIAQSWFASRNWRIDLGTIKGATIVVLGLRLILSLVGIFVSASKPLLPLEATVGVLSSQAPFFTWLQRLFVSPLMRFDAVRYQMIVEHGYRLEDGNAAFHPLYPFLGALLCPVVGNNTGLALLVVSTLASIGLCVVFTRYVADVHGMNRAQPATLVLLVAPPAFVLLMPYTESTFLVFAVTSMWAMHHRRWWLAGLLAGLATLTRQQGIALLAPLAWALCTALRQHQARPRDLAAILLIPLSYSLFVLYRAVALGDLVALANASTPAVFVRNLLVSPSSEHVIPGQRIAWPWELFIDQLRIIPLSRNSYHLIIDMVLGWAGILIVVTGIKHMTTVERWYSLGIIVLALCYYNGEAFPYLSLPRHILLAFPLFVVIMRRVQSKRHRISLMEGLLMCNIVLLGLCIRGIWIP